MKPPSTAIHIVCAAALIVFGAGAIFYPLFSGPYDVLAIAVSLMAQVAAIAGILFVPVGVAWIAYECASSAKGRRHWFAMAALVPFGLLGPLLVLVAIMAAGVALGIAVGAVVAWAFTLMVRGIKRMARSGGGFLAWPYYFASVAPCVLALQIAFTESISARARDHAVGQSRDLIAAIENHRAEHGSYPAALNAVWPDYTPNVVGIECFHYARSGDTYNLYFELPVLLLDNFGAREFVVYNPQDEHIMPSHAAWILIWPFEILEQRQGWFAVHDGPEPHWKYFWFD